ncbi:MAG: MoaD/ThiS family protein [Candidatus Hermodarchaeota archaeon]
MEFIEIIKLEVKRIRVKIKLYGPSKKIVGGSGTFFLEFEEDRTFLPHILRKLIEMWPALKPIICETQECTSVASHIVMIVNGTAVPDKSFNIFEVKENDLVIFSPFVVGG